MSRNNEHKGTSNRGFASMDQAKQRAIASKGGQSVPPEKRSFSQDPALAAEAGRKGGESVPPEGRSFSQNRELAAEAGRKGGQARGASSAKGAAKRNAARLRTMEAGQTRAKGQPFDEDGGAAVTGTQKGPLPEGTPDRQAQGTTRAALPSTSSELGDDYDADDAEDRTDYAARGEDLEGDDLGKTPGQRSFPGIKENPQGTQ